MFTVTVPKDFGEKKLTWTLVVNGKTSVIPISLHPLYEVSPFIEASGNTPPFIGFSENGPFVQGPRGQSTSLTATVSSPLTLTVWVADDAKSTVTVTRFAGLPVTVAWSKFRGPGAVTFASERPAVEQASFKPPPRRSSAAQLLPPLGSANRGSMFCGWWPTMRRATAGAGLSVAGRTRR